MSNVKVHWSPTIMAINPQMLSEAPMTIISVETRQNERLGLMMCIHLRINGTNIEGPFIFMPACDYEDGHCLEEVSPTRLNKSAREFIEDLGAREPDQLVLPAHNQVIGLFFMGNLAGLKRA